MNKSYTAVLVLAALALLVPASAEEICWTTSTPDVTIEDATGDLGGDLYVDNDLCQTEDVNPCLFSLWVYQETNKKPGLQRGDERANDVARCTDGTKADTNIF